MLAVNKINSLTALCSLGYYDNIGRTKTEGKMGEVEKAWDGYWQWATCVSQTHEQQTEMKMRMKIKTCVSSDLWELHSMDAAHCILDADDSSST